MASIRHLAAVLALVALAARGAWAEGFIAAYEDLPLAPGLIEEAGAGLAFDSPSGRIVEAYAHGALRPADILKFYATTLPQLGWTRLSDTQYRREAEMLRIDTQAEAKGAERKGVAVHFTISPE